MARILVLLAVIISLAAGSAVLAFASMLPADNQTNSSKGLDVAPAINESSEPEIGDGSICADYEEGEVPPAHLNCEATEEEYSDVTIVDRIRPANETAVEDDTGDQQLEAADSMPTVVGRQPDIAGPATDECREPLDNAFIAVLQTDQYMEFAYISEHVQEVYCNDVHVVVPGIPYNHVGYVLHSHPDRVYLNPAAYNLYSAPEDLAILLFHEARHLEQYKECKADRSLCMTSEERENDAIRFGNEMRLKIFPYQGDDGDHVIVIPPMETMANIVILNNGTETITPKTNATISIVGGIDESDTQGNMTISYDATTNASTTTITATTD